MAKAKRGFMDGYKTYDPSVEGHGSVDDWIRTASAAFDDPNFIAGLEAAMPRMGMGATSQPLYPKIRAQRIDPDLHTLGLVEMPPNETTLKSALRKTIISTGAHPDHGGSREALETLEKAWQRLVWKLRKATA